MARADQVLTMLLPKGGWIANGDEYEGIQFLDCDPITKAQFTAGFAQYDAWQAAQEAKSATDKAALLTKLGITAAEAKLLIG